MAEVGGDGDAVAPAGVRPGQRRPAEPRVLRGAGQNVSFDGPDLDVDIEGTGPGPPASLLLARLRGQLPAGMPVVVNTINGRLLPIGRVPA